MALLISNGLYAEQLSYLFSYLKMEYFTGMYVFFMRQGTDNSSPPGQIGRHFADDILRYIFVNEKFFIFIIIWLKFVPKGSIDNNPALV